MTERCEKILFDYLCGSLDLKQFVQDNVKLIQSSEANAKSISQQLAKRFEGQLELTSVFIKQLQKEQSRGQNRDQAAEWIKIIVTNILAIFAPGSGQLAGCTEPNEEQNNLEETQFFLEHSRKAIINFFKILCKKQGTGVSDQVQASLLGVCT